MISVIMLTYNREALVGRAIESILNQTYKVFEFIIIDNGSTDKSGEIAEEYAAKDNRIQVIHLERGNIGSGRNVGLDKAKFEYIAFIDDDDYCEPDFLEFLLNLAQENHADVAICGAVGRAYDIKKIMNAEEAVIELLWRKRYNMAFPTKLFTKSLSEKIRFSEKGHFDDISLMYKLLAEAKVVAYHGLPKYTFQRHSGNTSAWTTDYSLLNADILEEYLETYKKRTEWLSNRFPNSRDAFQYFEWSFMISMVDKINRFHIKECDLQLKRLLQELNKNKSTFLNSVFTKDFEKAWIKQYLS